MKKVIFLALISTSVFSQDLKTKFNWYNLHLEADGPGRDPLDRGQQEDRRRDCQASRDHPGLR